LKLINYLIKDFLFIFSTYILLNINFIIHSNFVISFKKYINESININIYKNLSFLSRYDSFGKAKNFLNNCLNEKYIYNETIRLTKNPEVSAIIPIFNCSKFKTKSKDKNTKFEKCFLPPDNPNIKIIHLIFTGFLIESFKKEYFGKIIYKDEYILNGIRVMKKYLLPSLNNQSCK